MTKANKSGARGSRAQHLLTGILEEDEEAKLGRVRSETDEEQCVAPDDKREPVITGIP